MTRTIRTGAVALLLLLAPTLTACGSDGGGQGGTTKTAPVTVRGQVGSKPKVKVTGPLRIRTTKTSVLDRGQGSPLRQGTYLIGISLFSKAGKPLASTYDKGQRPVSASLGQGGIFPVVEKAFKGKPAGSRVLIQAAAKDAYGSRGNPQIGVQANSPVVMVADLLATTPDKPLEGPQGKPGPGGGPKLRLAKGVPTGFDFTGVPKPTKPARWVVTQGDGPAVTANKIATVNYLGAVYGQSKAFDQSYTRGQTASFPIGTGGVIPCWDSELQGVKVGSRVVLACPPGTAYGAQGQPPAIPGNATLFFVVDVLGVD